MEIFHFYRESKGQISAGNNSTCWRSRSTIDPAAEMSAELLATYAGLGTQDGEEYYRGDECLGETFVSDLSLL